MALHAETFDADLDDVAVLEVVEAAGEADALGGSGEDEVAGLELHELAELEDDRADVEDQVGSCRVLAALTVDGAREAQVAQVDLVRA